MEKIKKLGRLREFHSILSRAKFCREFYADRVNPASYFASAARALYPETFSAEFCSGEYSVSHRKRSA